MSLNDIKQSITMKEAITVMENAFKALYLKKAVLPLRTPVEIEKEKALMLTMPAYLSDEGALGLKVVSIFPDNITKSLPAITGAMLLLDAHTGEIKAMMDAGYLTGLRTGAVSGLATKYLATSDASHVAIIGSGVQAATQLSAVSAVRNIKYVSIWSRNIENAEAFAATVTGCEVSVCPTIGEAVRNADIICTATGSLEPLIYLGDLKPGVHINAIGSHTLAMHEVADDIMGEAFVVVDQLQAALSESGEIHSAIKNHYLKVEDIHELGEIIEQRNLFPQQKLSVFKSVGLAIQDISIANKVYENAIAQKLGYAFELS
ncbi:MAG: ornithine cyclodeaminase family protein [Legionella sp.]|nr:ornithine cyclodeaminase family protein [Legionella sp.]